MRKIKKVLKAHSVQALVYDTIEKAEKSIIVTVTEIEEAPKIPEGCVLINSQKIEESDREIVYTMTAKEFLEHATIELPMPPKE